MSKRRANFLVLLLAFWLSTGGLFTRPVSGMNQEPGNQPGQEAIQKIDPLLQELLRSAKPTDQLDVIVRMAQQEPAITQPGKQQKKARQDLLKSLKTRAEADQKALKQLLKQKKAKGQTGESTSFWIFNGLAVKATPAVIQAMAERPDVAFISPDRVFLADEALAQAHAVEPTTNLSRTGAPAMWNLGYRGQGVVVANMDTGVYVDHPDLIKQWRGGTNSWYDPYKEHPTHPVDYSAGHTGHGTYTMGVMVGQGTSGLTIGMAPDAQWIAVKIFNNRGAATVSAIHKGFQWLLDPDGNPNTDDAPDVVNNSWGSASSNICNREFQLDLQALRAANILPVFSAGNEGATRATSPADLPEAFSVGAIDPNNQVWVGSSQGPSVCDSAIFPKLMAPGVDIWTATAMGDHANQTGTSMAAPHVAGGLALLLSAFPGLPVELQEQALIQTATDLDIPGPDDASGYGSVNVLAAYDYLNGFLPYRNYIPILFNISTGD